MNYFTSYPISFFLYFYLVFVSYFADGYISRSKSDSGIHYGDASLFPTNDNGFMSNTNSLPKEEPTYSTGTEPSRVLDPRHEVSKRSMGSISALKELVII